MLDPAFFFFVGFVKVMAAALLVRGALASARRASRLVRKKKRSRRRTAKMTKRATKRLRVYKLPVVDLETLVASSTSGFREDPRLTNTVLSDLRRRLREFRATQRVLQGRWGRYDASNTDDVSGIYGYLESEVASYFRDLDSRLTSWEGLPDFYLSPTGISLDSD